MSDEIEAPKPIDIVVSLLKTKQLRVTWRPDFNEVVSPAGIDGARWLHDGRGWTIPAISGHELLAHFHKNHPHARVSFERDAAALITEQLQREASTSTLAIATTGNVPDVLSVTLRDFQRAALAYLLSGISRKVLALDTGLGKTAVATAYARIRGARTLWITKPALVNNLVREIKKLTGENALPLKGSNPSSESLRHG